MLDNEATIPVNIAAAKPGGWRLPIGQLLLSAALRAMRERWLWTSRPDPLDGCYAPDPFGTERSFVSGDWRD